MTALRDDIPVLISQWKMSLVYEIPESVLLARYRSPGRLHVVAIGHLQVGCLGA